MFQHIFSICFFPTLIKSDATPRRNWFGKQESLNGVDDCRDLLTVYIDFSVEILNLEGKVWVGREEFTKPDKGPNNEDAHLHRTWAVENG
jgi:hypothetical protein